jgi:hypothetical protein
LQLSFPKVPGRYPSEPDLSRNTIDSENDDAFSQAVPFWERQQRRVLS